MQDERVVFHRYPINDRYEHNIDGPSCHCYPMILSSIEKIIVMHNAYLAELNKLG